ncbi:MULTISPECIES: hypothetical protein [unclassified Pseudomonas]|uniref:hypothetical protein n=1 Tax=unclassified Pseudomonas TaxID=196821 RepID=UPI000CD071BC|nr:MULTISPECIES: hypothetical protein [unclassified Pseudomonas]POA55357.1 hypothetical protein C1889_13400 [Pseudomonas sp. FW507-12TSA]
MSGPKVVRIVTREEIIALCEGHLQRLEQAMARWEAQAARLGELNEEQRNATRARAERLRALLGQEQFARLQRAVPIEIEYLRRDQTEREERAVLRATEQRQRQRRQQENAATLLGALRAAQAAVAPELLQDVARLAEGTDLAHAQQVLAQGFSQLARVDETDSLSERQRELARQLREETPQASLEQWIAAQQPAERDPRLQRIDRHIAELQLLQGAPAATPFLQRLARAEAQEQAQQRNLLLDSLVIELAEATRDFQQRRELLGQVQDLASELHTHATIDHAALLRQVAECHEHSDLALLQALKSECEAALTAVLQAQAALARRQAMLEGLARLGYEVREGMATAWAESGKVVLRKSATPGYGVEVGGKADNGRLQVRAVALDPQRDKGRDRDIETIWCNEFQRLQALLKDSGGELLIERALGVGEVPLKEATVMDEEREAANLQQRTL